MNGLFNANNGLYQNGIYQNKRLGIFQDGLFNSNQSNGTGNPYTVVNVAANLAGLDFAGNVVIVPKTSEIDYLYSRGIRYIRLPFSWEKIQPTLFGELDSTIKGYIDSIVSYCASKGMKVLLDVHNYGAFYGEGIDNINGTVPRAAFNSLWIKLATAYRNNSAIWGYDIMNEPQGGAIPLATTWHSIAQDCVNAIRTVDTTTFIFIEGWGFSSAYQWRVNNENLNIIDPSKKIIYSAHSYLDRDNSGSHYIWDQEVAAGDALDGGATLDTNIGVKRISVFNSWLKDKGFFGHIGEMGVAEENDNWNLALEKAVNYCEAQGISFTYWAAGDAWGSYPYGINVYPVNATYDRRQMAVLTKHTGAAQSNDLLIFANGISSNGIRATVGQPISVSYEYRGYIQSPITLQTVITGGTGSLDTSSITFNGLFNGKAVVQFTPTQSAVYKLTMTNSQGYNNTVSVPISTKADMFSATQEAETIISFYNINTAYAGAVIRLQRDLDYAQSDFNFDSSGWIDRAAIEAWAQGSVLRIVKIYGQTNGNNLNQYDIFHYSQPYGDSSDKRYMPIYLNKGDEKTTDLEPCIIWRQGDGATRATLDANTTFTEKTFLINANVTSTFGNSYLLSFGAENYIQLFSDSGASFQVGSTTNIANITQTANQFKAYATSFKGNANIKTYVNGVADSSTTTTIPEFSATFNKSKFNLGFFVFYFPTGLPAGTKYKDIIIWEKELTSTQLGTVQTYMASKPAITPLPSVPSQTITITDSGGAALPTGILKSVGISGAEGWAGNRYHGVPNYDYVHTHDLSIILYFKNKGFNCIRLALEWQRLQLSPYGILNMGDIQAIDRVVQYCRSLGMYVILEPHDYGQRSNYILGVDSQAPASMLANLWSRLATAYKNQSNVIFNLMNEPYAQTPSQWADVAVACVTAIRATGATQKIQIPGTYFTGAHSWVSSGNSGAWDAKITAGFTDSNYEFEMHQYLDGDSSGNNTACALNAGSTRLVAATTWARGKGVKIFLGEVGWSADSSCPSEATAIMNYLTSNTDVWSGWSYWATYQFAPSQMYALNPLDISSPVDKPQLITLAPYLQ